MARRFFQPAFPPAGRRATIILSNGFKQQKDKAIAEQAGHALVTELSVPSFPPGVQLRQDPARQRWVMLVPERVLVPDAPAVEILRRCDGRTSVGSIVNELVQTYAAERGAVLIDVLAMLQNLSDKRFIVDGRAAQTVNFGETSRPELRIAAETVGLALKNTGLLPLAVLAEITHRCPLHCPYCSNPVNLERASAELTTQEWKRLIDEITGLGVLQIHFSGGEPLVRADLIDLVRHATAAGLYTNLITSGVLLNREKLAALAAAGLEHVQISFQDADEAGADVIGGFKGAHRRKREAARLVREIGLPLTVNAVVHRRNLERLPGLIDMAVELGAARLEVAHVQYLGWALKNRAALIPTVAQLDEATNVVEAARERLKGTLVIDYVIPDYYAVRPKTCMGGWGEKFFNITPSGKVLPCHAAESITGLSFDSARNHSLSWIWSESPAMQKYRGTGWMKEPCKSCEYRDIDRGGCRCQAFALTGDAGMTDPTCAKSSRHAEIVALAVKESETDNRHFDYRSFSGCVSKEGQF
jgi:pyrroloquinoline quinone biosynthesis protein E